jgi:hypothetical protein
MSLFRCNGSPSGSEYLKRIQRPQIITSPTAASRMTPYQAPLIDLRSRNPMVVEEDSSPRAMDKSLARTPLSR